MPPILGEVGEKIFQNVSKEAFKMFLEHFKMVVNEYRLDLSSPSTDKIFEDQMQDYFFGAGMQLPGRICSHLQKINILILNIAP